MQTRTGRFFLVVIFMSLTFASMAMSRVIYQDNCDGNDYQYRYKSNYGGDWSYANQSYSTPNQPNHWMADTGSTPAAATRHTTYYNHGDFTFSGVGADEIVTYSLRNISNPATGGPYTEVTLLKGAAVNGTYAGYNFRLTSSSTTTMTLQITRTSSGGTVTTLDTSSAQTSDNLYDWNTVTVRVQVLTASVSLTMTWEGFDSNGNAVTCTRTYSDTSASRITSGGGLGIKTYAGSDNLGVQIDNIEVKSGSEVVYTDDCEGADSQFRYSADSGNTWSCRGESGLHYEKAPGGGLYTISTKPYAGGDFTSTTCMASCRYRNWSGQNPFIQLTLLNNGAVGTNKYKGYNFDVWPDGTNLYLEIYRTETNGTMTSLYTSSALPSNNLAGWNTVKAAVDVQSGVTHLTLIWEGCAQGGGRTVYVASVDDTSSSRYTSGTGLGMRAYAGNDSKGILIDDLTVENSSGDVLYHDDFESDDFDARYTLDYSLEWTNAGFSGGRALQVPASTIKTNEMKLRDSYLPCRVYDDPQEDPIEDFTDSYANGNFTNTSYKVTYNLHNISNQAPFLTLTLLNNGSVTDSRNHPSHIGYNFQAYPNGATGLYLWIGRTTANGTVTNLVCNDPPYSSDNDYDWSTVTCEVQTGISSTYLKLTWDGYDSSDNPVSYSVDYTDSSQYRITSGAGLGFQGYAGNDGLGMQIDDLKVDDLESVPDWWNSTLGVDNSVLSPFTNMSYSSGVVSCWGRSYSFSSSLPVPSQITTQNENILYSPITLKAKVDDNYLTWTNTMYQATTQQANKVVIHTQNRGQATNNYLDAVTTLEYDGMVRVDLSLKGDTDSTLNEFTMEIPIKVADATLFWAQCEDDTIYGNDPWWAGGHNGTVGTSQINGPFTPYMWLGNDILGLVWFAESQRNYANSDQENVIQIIPDTVNGKVTLKIKFVEYDIPMDKPINLTFGFQATPVKPIPSGARTRIYYPTEFFYKDRTTTETSSVGQLVYPALGNFNYSQGSVHLKVKVNHNPTTESTSHSLWGVYWPNDNYCRLLWNGSNKQMQALMHDDGSNYASQLASISSWTVGSTHDLTLTWGSSGFSIWGDGSQIASHNTPNYIPDDSLYDAVMKLQGDFFYIDAIKMTDTLYTGGSIDYSSGGLLRDNFSTILWSGSWCSATQADTASGCGGGLITGSYDDTTNSGMIAFTGSATNPWFFDYWADMGCDRVTLHETWTDWECYPESITIDPEQAPTNAEELSDYVTEAHTAGLKVDPYIGSWLGSLADKFEQYRDISLVKPYDASLGGYRTSPAQYYFQWSYAGQWTNFQLSKLYDIIDDYGLDGLYMDTVAIPFRDVSISNGSGYVDRDGNLQPTWKIFGYREYIKRLATMGRSLNSNFKLDFHCSGPIWTPTASFVDNILTGEHIGKGGVDPRSDLTTNRFRANFGAQYGLPIDFLNAVYGSYTQAISLLHDVVTRSATDFDVYAAQDRFGIDGSTTTFYPYYATSPLVTATGDDVYVSYYKKTDNSLLLAVSNLGDSNVTSTVTIDDSLTLPSNAKAVDELKRTWYTILGTSDHTVTVPLTPWTIHYISIVSR